MKHKFYLALLFTVVISPAFANLSVTINSPVANQLVAGSVSVSVSVSSSYNLARVYAKAGGDSAYLGNTIGINTNALQLTTLPHDTFTITVVAEDVLHNKDSATVKVIKDYPPVLQITAPGKVVLNAMLHIRAAATDEGNTHLNIVGPAPLYLPLAEGDNVIDTIIDFSGFVGPAGQQANNLIQVLATDSRGQVTTQYIPSFFLLNSPYLQLYHRFEDSATITDANYDKWLVYSQSKKTNTLFDFNHGDSTLIPGATGSPARSITKTGVAFQWGGGKLAVWHADSTDYFNIGGLFFVKGNYAVLLRNDSFFHFNMQTYTVTPISKKYGGGINSLDAEGDVVFTIKGYGEITSDTAVVLSFPGEYSVFGKGFLARNHRILYTDVYGSGLYFASQNTNMFVDGITESDMYFLGHDFGAYTKRKINTQNYAPLWLLDTTGRKILVDSNTAVQYIYEISSNGEIIYCSVDSGKNTLNLNWANMAGVKKTLVYNINDPYSVKVFYNNGWYVAFNNNYVYSVNPFAVDSLTEIKREAKKDSSYSFKGSDFDKAFISEGSLFEVKITRLPKYGTLYLSGRPLTVTDTILRHAVLNLLSYKPGVGYVGKDTLYWNGSTGNGNFTSHDTLIEMSVVEALPVTLTSLKAEAIGKVNLLTWQTTQEVNSSYFEVQKSLDGNSFSPIGKVQAQGNSSVKQDYRYSDGNPVPIAKNYYRLKVVDRDGKYSFTKIVWLKNTVSSGINLYPNPVKTNVQVSLANIEAGRYCIAVYSLAGKAVVSRQYTLPAANQVISLPVNSLAAGVYIIKVTTNSGTVIATQKIVKE